MARLRKSGVIGILAAMLAAPVAGFAATLDLNFSPVSDPSFGTPGNLVLNYGEVAEGINASLTALNPFIAANGANNGAAAGDLRINMLGQQSAEFRLDLWDSTAGTGYEEAYDPGRDFSWTMGFYDIDGLQNKRRDVVTLLTPAAYTLTGNTRLDADTSTEGEVSFTIRDPGDEVDGQEGLTELTEEQADVAVLFTLTNQSSLSFGYEVAGINNGRNGRNLIVDGGDLVTALDPFDPVTAALEPSPVPLPAPAGLLLGGLAAFGVLRRRQRRAGSV